MLIDTRTMGFTLTDAILRHVETRVESALGAFAGRILKVTVRLDDVNAGRGGVDKRCGIIVALRRHQVAVAPRWTRRPPASAAPSSARPSDTWAATARTFSGPARS